LSEEWGFAVVRRRNEYKNRNFVPPISSAYIFWRGDRITPRSFSKIYKFPRNKRTQTTIFAAFQDYSKRVAAENSLNA